MNDAFPCRMWDPAATQKYTKHPALDYDKLLLDDATASADSVMKGTPVRVYPFASLNICDLTVDCDQVTN